MACIASAAPTLQHAAMREYLAKLMQPLTLALLLTWSAVGLALGGEAGLSLPLAWSLMLAFLVASLLTDLPRLSRAWVYVLLLVQAASALALVWLAPRTGITSVLLVVLAAQLGLMWPLRRTLVAVLLLDAVFLLLILDNGHPAPYLVVMIYGGFQAFALLIGHYASTAQQVRDRLMRLAGHARPAGRQRTRCRTPAHGARAARRGRAQAHRDDPQPARAGRRSRLRCSRGGRARTAARA
jgi:hypothetical protein